MVSNGNGSGRDSAAAVLPVNHGPLTQRCKNINANNATGFPQMIRTN